MDPESIKETAFAMRNFLHYLASILMWILFGYYWYVVVERQIGRDSLQPVAILLGMTALGLAFTLWWIAHNKRIAARGNRNTLMAPPVEPFERDNLHRPIVAPDMDRLKTASAISVHVDEDGNKVYTIGGEGEA
jgi:hypothetical protein